ncbi:NADP-dependent isocitrate dehydrogenase [Hyphomonas adhaerens MHS-3]|uniref:NADP-dependent isocitrate dehydrogenase n=1 Tax=Hyphomonas adhaerens MHS-3 TaxID=1280949 RepID=A0A069E8J3_9PROT|nr:NADP-dependent isocitrate dehydrogenase [Hyphomonas adhaerens MHS-3]
MSEGSGLRHRLFEVLGNFLDEAFGGQVSLIRPHEEGEVFRHEAGFDRLDDGLLQRLRKFPHFRRTVHPAAMVETLGPGVDRGDRVGRGRFAFLVVAVVAGDCAVGGFGFDRVAIRAHQDRRHQAQRAVTLGNRVGLDVAVIVLAGPDIAAGPLHAGCNHVVDQAVLIGAAELGELVSKLGVEDFLEDVLEAAVIGFQDRVLGRQVDRPLALQAIVHAGAGEVADRLVEVVHAHGDTGAGEVEHFEFLGVGPVGGFPLHGQLAFARHEEVGGLVLVAKCVTADDDRTGPARHQTRDVRDHDRLAEHDAAEDVTDRAVRRAPHLLQAELFHAGFVRRDRCALHSHAIFLGSVGGVDGDLVVGFVALLDRQVVILQVDVQVGVDQLVFDKLPDDAGHFVPVHLDDRVLDLDFRHIWKSLRL